MSNFSLLIIPALVVLLCVKINVSFSLEPPKHFDYDVLKLTQSWPETSCWYLNPNVTRTVSPRGALGDKDCSPCRMPGDETSWTLHGLWPSKLHGKHHPAFCAKTPYDPTAIDAAGLRGRMVEEWPTYDLRGSDDAFWGHEWEKHGTCATDIESTADEGKYFAKALDLLELYNAGRVLAKVGMEPGQSYGVDEIYKRLVAALKVNVYIGCVTIHRKGESHQCLYQIEICFDRTFKMVDCEQSANASCDRGKEVLFPKNEKSCPLMHNNV